MAFRLELAARKAAEAYTAVGGKACHMVKRTTNVISTANKGGCKFILGDLLDDWDNLIEYIGFELENKRNLRVEISKV